jgi:subtilase family serine protease
MGRTGEAKPMKAIRSAILILALTLTGVTAMTEPSAVQAQTQAPSAVTTGVMVILTAKAGVTREQIMAIMPDEIRQTVQLYLTGKVREWYSRSDGRGAVFLLDSKDVAEAHATMDALPLARQDLIDHEYIAVGPLMPLRLLMAKP